MLGHDVILRAVRKSTRETMAIVRVSMLPWYKGEGRQKGKTSNLECTKSNRDQGNTLTLTIVIVC